MITGPSKAVRHGGRRSTKNLQVERERERKGKERGKRKEKGRRAREKDVTHLL